VSVLALHRCRRLASSRSHLRRGVLRSIGASTCSVVSCWRSAKYCAPKAHPALWVHTTLGTRPAHTTLLVVQPEQQTTRNVEHDDWHDPFGFVATDSAPGHAIPGQRGGGCLSPMPCCQTRANKPQQTYPQVARLHVFGLHEPKGKRHGTQSCSGDNSPTKQWGTRNRVADRRCTMHGDQNLERGVAGAWS
jgi:hypothetical protein